LRSSRTPTPSPLSGLDRRQALWRVRGLGEAPLPLFAAADALGQEPEVLLTPLTGGREVVEDYRSVQLSLREHPVAFLRGALGPKATSCADLARLKDGARVEVAGLVLIRQRPGKGNVTFITLEDETGSPTSSCGSASSRSSAGS
jgi:error-prone DNA polymerase